MSHHDRDAEIAAFIRTKGVTRCPTACSVPTQGSPDLADQAALEQYALARDELARSKIATRWQVFGPAVPELSVEYPVSTGNDLSGHCLRG
jgi:hypothetical protein